jgi:hypothetical protein
MRIFVTATAVALLLAQALAATAAADAGIRQEKVQFAKDATSAVIKGQLKGDAMVDYTVRAAAGQTLTVTIQKSNGQNYFNVLPPGSSDVAMFVGDTGEGYSGLLPADGDYTIRVYLMRPAARRGETSSYTLTVGVTGKPLAPVAASIDALLPGTAYHASAGVKCVPAYATEAGDCDAFVVRRDFDGTATVDITGGPVKRSILFVKGKPVATNAQAMDALTSERKGDVTVVKLGTTELYEIPDALLTGG